MTFRITTISVNIPESSGKQTVVVGNCGPYPSIAMSTEVNQKLSSGDGGRLTREVTCISDIENLRRSARNLLIQTRTPEAHKTFSFVIIRRPNDGVNTPESGSCTIRDQTNWGAYPSIAMSTEANQKLSSGGEDRLTRFFRTQFQLLKHAEYVLPLKVDINWSKTHKNGLWEEFNFLGE